MIGSVSVELFGEARTLRLTMKAMARIERALCKPISVVMREMDGELSVGALVEILAASWSDGRGVKSDVVFALLDKAGFDALEEVSEALGALVEAAFPQAGDEGAGKKKGQTS